MSLVYDGGMSLGGIPLGGSRKLRAPRSVRSLPQAARAGLSEYQEALRMIKEKYPGQPARSVYSQLKDQAGSVSGVLAHLQGARASTKRSPRAVRCRPAVKATKKSHGVRLTPAERAKLRKMLEGKVQHGDACPVCQGSGFWDTLGSIAKVAVPIASAFL